MAIVLSCALLRSPHSDPFSVIHNVTAHSNNDRYATLGVATHIYVISLPRRDDRYIQMEWIRRTQNITWRVLDAIDSDDPVVVNIMDSVARGASRTQKEAVHTSV